MFSLDLIYSRFKFCTDVYIYLYGHRGKTAIDANNRAGYE
jgi:hypothetical protein